MRPFTLLLTVALLSGCGSSAPVVEAPPPPEPETPAGPSFTAIQLEGGSVVARDLLADVSTVLAPLEGDVTARHGDPTGAASAVVVAAGDSTRLVVTTPEGVDVVATRPAPVVYTVAWAPSGDAFAFGYYRPTTRDARPAMGAGDIRVYTRGTRESRRVGCSASKAVLAWLPGARLLVRDTDNLYVVGADDCATMSSVDARRMHQLTASPDGAHIVYVHRELVYDRDSRQYVADSTFMIANVDGSNGRTVVNFRYRPARFAWSPDGSELAYDVQNPDRPEQRLISIFDVDAGTSAYLHPPSAGGPSEYDVHWSPDGGSVLYRQDDALAVRTFADPYPVVLEGTTGADPIEWAGSGAVVARLADGRVRVYPLWGGEVFELPSGSVLAVRPKAP